MTEVIERPVEADEEVLSPGLFQVWFDLGFGARYEEEWWWDRAPEPLASALDHSARLKAEGWVTKVLPEGVNPRPDGRWDNPP